MSDEERLNWLAEHASSIRVLQDDKRFFTIPPTRAAIDRAAVEIATHCQGCGMVHHQCLCSHED